MPRMNRTSLGLWLGAALCALSALGCGRGRLPYYGPWGQGQIISAEPTATPRAVVVAPAVAPHVATSVAPGVSITPSRVIAPVGSEVVLKAGLCGADGFLATGERIDWTLEGAGQLVATAREGLFSSAGLWGGSPAKIGNNDATAYTSSRRITLTRGTPTPSDDVPVLSGQAWISVASATEGVSHVTALASNLPQWDRRRQTASVYWIDAQWRFPAPAIVAAGGRTVLTTNVTRHTNSEPVAGWLVRYQITSGPSAGFAPQGSASIEVPTDATGRAAVEVFQPEKAGGVTQVAVEIIRPARPGGEAAMVVGRGATTVRFSAPALAMRCSGPSQASVGATAVYTFTVTNPGDMPAENVVVTMPVVESVELAGSNPPAQRQDGTLAWNLGQLAAGASRNIGLDLRPGRKGELTLCADAKADAALAARCCAKTTVTGAGLLALRVEREAQPREVRVGDTVRFRITVTNNGDAPASGVVIEDHFDPGLEHPSDENWIRRTLGDIAPGETREVGVTFRVTKPGKLCHRVKVSASGVTAASGSGCVDVAAPVAAAVEVKVTGPASGQTGSTAKFIVTVANRGNVAISDLTAKVTVEAALRPDEAAGFAYVGNQLVWKVPQLAPGKEAVGQVNCACVKAADNACCTVSVAGADNVSDKDSACLRITAAPAAAAPVLGVRITNTNNPIRVGAETTYRVSVRNTGRTDARGVAMKITLPGGLQLKKDGTVTRPVVTFRHKDGVIEFDPVAQFRAGEPPLVYEFTVIGMTVGKDQPVGAHVTADGLNQAIQATSGTTVLAD